MEGWAGGREAGLECAEPAPDTPAVRSGFGFQNNYHLLSPPYEVLTD